MTDKALKISDRLQKRLNQITAKYPASEISMDRMIDYPCIIANQGNLHDIMSAIASWDDVPMNYLRCITAVDQLTHIEVVYFLSNIPSGENLSVVTSCPRDGGVLKSVFDIWDTADLQEREVYEFFGVTFDGHPDPRRLLTPEQYKGFPLLKDYPKGGDPDDLLAVEAYLPDGWIEKQKEEKENLKKWLQDEIAKRQSKPDSAKKADGKE